MPAASRGALLSHRGSAFIARCERALGARYAPLAAGAITALLVAFVWGGLSAPGAYHDERAYLVQARLLAHFSWTAPAPPLPIFWEMAHLFVEPAIFAKYPPGHAPLLVPGIWLGLAGLVPILFASISGALTFALARRFAGVWVALGTWTVWTTVPETLDWHSSYFSETTTAALWLVALWLLVDWRARERPAVLVALVGCVGWMGITRPVTAMMLALPILVVVLRTAWTRRALSGWPVAAALGALIIAIVPYWSVRTLGEVSPLPYAEYSKWYFPWDMPGFVRDTAPPLRTLPPDLELLADATRQNYDGHTAEMMPVNFIARSHRLLTGALGPVAEPLWVLVPLGALALGGAVTGFALASFVLLLGVYLVMPHSPGWTIYYLELMPLVVFLAITGLARATALVAEIANQRGWRRLAPHRIRLAVGLVVAGMVLLTITKIPDRRWHERLRSSRQLLARQLIAELPDPHAVIFVRRTSPMSAHFTLWDILGPPATTPTWIVRDLGAGRDADLVALANGRRPYILDEATMTLSEWTPVSAARVPTP